MKTTGKLIIFLITFLALAASACAQSPHEQLNQMVEQLQKTPTDNAQREKIIRFAAGINPAPAIPEEARRAFVRGNATMSEAKMPEEYARAVQLYTEALLIAPWWSDPYFNLAKAHELRKEYDSAILGLRFFLLTGIAGSDARQAQDQIYVLEEKRDRQAKADETRRREEAQKLQRQTWAKDLSRWMTENYGRSLLSKVQHCFYCTDEDARGANWTYAEAMLPPDYNKLSKDWLRLGKKLSFRTAGQANDEIVFSGVAHNGVMVTDFCGTVNGPRQEDINWKQCNNEYKSWNGTAASAVFTTSSDGKPMVKIKGNCQPDGHCSHANLMLE
ncbi:MAG: hypothetical protein HYV23_01005 [Deltaproteobacteria bacterium]|nr:hypothetical protein [Deltaproteobacteria bacterium]